MVNIVNSLTGSSIDVQALAKSLTEAERAPRQAMLDKEKTVAENKVSSIGRIYSAANDMKTAMTAFGDPAAASFQPQSSDDTKASFSFRPYYKPSAIDFSFKVKQLASTNSVMLSPLGLNSNLVGDVTPAPTRMFNIYSGARSGAVDLTAGSTVQFNALATGAAVTVGGMTLTASADMTATEVATAFASVADGVSGTAAKGAFTGTLSGWSSGAASGGVVVFTNTASNSPVASADGNAVQPITQPGTALASFDLSHYSSLDALRDAVKATTGFDATIMTATTPGSADKRYLTITHGTGSANRFFVDTTTNGAIDAVSGTGAASSGLRIGAPAAGGGTDPGQSYGVNAQIEANGIVSESATNRFSTLVSGLNIDVKTVTGDSTVRLSTFSDTAKFTNALRAIVATFNTLMLTIENEVKYDADIQKRGGLSNDFVAKNFMSQMRRLTTSPITTASGTSVSLAGIGVRTKLDGTLTIDETQLSKITDSYPEMLASVISSTDSTSPGAMVRMTKLSDLVLGLDSSFVQLSDKETKVEIPKIDDRIAALNTQMDAIQARYLKQFTEMQSFVNQSQSTQTSLTNSFTAWTNGLKG